MPLYEIEGRGKQSGRKRNPITVNSKDEITAMSIARRVHSIEPDHVRPIEIRHYETRVAGGSYSNSDGTNRQRIIAKCTPGDVLIIEHEQGNRHDKHATRILQSNGNQVGYVPKDIAEEIYEEFHYDAGCRYLAVAGKKSQYSQSDTRLHMEMIIIVALNSVTDSDIQEYAHKLQINIPDAIFCKSTPYRSIPISKISNAKTSINSKNNKPHNGCIISFVWMATVITTVSCLVMFYC